MKIKISTPLMALKSKQIRARLENDGTPAYYAVLSVIHHDRFSGGRLQMELHKKPRNKRISLLCFSPGIYNGLSEGDLYMFRGFVSFGYGNTYLVVEEVVSKDGEILNGFEEPLIV